MIKNNFLIMLILALGGASGAPASARDDSVPRMAKNAMQEISKEKLPPEARDTLQLIERGGPFPYERDGIVFGNFEKKLPQKERGHYQEYTVKTPGVKHRGARRIIAGGCPAGARKSKDGPPVLAPCDKGERYYTGDHYRSFSKVAP
jgi:ribonuclease T1